MNINDIKSTKLEKAITILSQKCGNKEISGLAAKCLSGLKQRMIKFNRVNGDFGNPQRIISRKLLYELLIGFVEELKDADKQINEEDPPKVLIF